jgi:hypothetical protein
VTPAVERAVITEFLENLVMYLVSAFVVPTVVVSTVVVTAVVVSTVVVSTVVVSTVVVSAVVVSAVVVTTVVVTAVVVSAVVVSAVIMATVIMATVVNDQWTTGIERQADIRLIKNGGVMDLVIARTGIPAAIVTVDCHVVAAKLVAELATASGLSALVARERRISVSASDGPACCSAGKLLPSGCLNPAGNCSGEQGETNESC